jgi:hypothetical protein
MSSKALRQEYKLKDTIDMVADYFTPQQRSDFKSRSLTADHTAAVQSACTDIAAAGGGYEMDFGDGVVCLTSPVTVAAPLSINGKSVSPYTAAVGTRGGGSWFYINHTGVGFDIDGAAIFAGVRLQGFGTFRSQPTPGGGWTPTAHDFDFDIDNADVQFEDVTLLNPTKAIRLANGEAGRLSLRRVRGQPLQVGMQIDKALDTVTCEDVRWWPFWKDDSNVHAYTLQNLDAFWFKRADNPMLSNIFSIFARAGLRFSQTADGRTSKMRVVNADLDRGKYGMWIDNTVTSGVVAQFANYTSQGETALAGSIGVFIEGNNSVLQFPCADLRQLTAQAVSLTGTGNQLRFGDLTIEDFDTDASGDAAINRVATNELFFGNPPRIGAGTWFSGSGNMQGLLKVEEASGTTDGSGEITVTHGLGLTPSKATASVLGTSVFAHTQCGSFTSTTFKVKFFDAAGAAMVGATLGFLWEVWA